LVTNRVACHKHVRQFYKYALTKCVQAYMTASNVNAFRGNVITLIIINAYLKLNKTGEL